MKKLKISLLSLALLFGITSYAQSNHNTMPSVVVQKLDGSKFNTSQIENDGKPIILNFWATWCSPCKRELNNIAEMYDEWQEETGVKIIAMSIDDTRNMAKVAPYVNGKGWDYEVYIDPNGDLKRALSVNNIPHTFLLDGNGEIVWQHNSYSEGDEYELYELVLKLSEGKKID
ncbi:MAG: TlpA disulfide reductase family protein [Vicingaceae bacterium]